MNRTRALLAFLISLLLVPSLPAAVQGVIMTIDGKPIENASVSAYTPESSTVNRERLQSGNAEADPLATAVTDKAGKFTLDAKTQPVVRLAITAAGYAPRGTLASGADDIGALPLTVASLKTGTVTAAGKPVAGATLVWSGSASAELIAKTDDKGRYTVPDPEKWATGVLVIHPDFARSQTGGFRVKLPLDQRLDGGVDVSGTVTAADGKTPVAGASLFVDEWKSGESAADGSFVIHHLPAKWEEIRVAQGDLAGAMAHTGNRRSIRMRPAASVGGTVKDPKSGAGIPGILVRISEGQPRGAGRSEVSDSKGRFLFDGLVPGDFFLSSTSPDALDATAQFSVAVGDKLQKNLSLVRTATVTGEVIDEAKHGVPAAMLQPFEAGQRFPRMRRSEPTFSAPDGRFVIREVAPNEDLMIQAQKKGQPSATTASQKYAPGERKTGLIITLPLGIALTGRVTDHDGNPLAGVTVDANISSVRPGMNRRIVLGLNSADDESSPQTDRDGAFEIRLKEGRYDLRFARSGFASKSVSGITVAASPKPVDVVLDPGVEISGRIVRADGSGVGDVRVNVFGDSSGDAMTGPDGSFVISDLAPGQMMLMAMKPEDFISERRSVSAPTSNLVIELPAGGIVAGRVIDKSTKEPITSFRAGPSNAGEGGGMRFIGPRMQQSFRSDDGTFALENLPSGQTQLLVDAPGYVTATISGLTVDPDKPIRDLEVALEQGVKLTGKITGPDRASLAGAQIIENTGDAQPMGRGRMAFGSDGDGTYTIDGLENGEHTFSFSKSGYVSERKTVKLSAKETTLDVRLSHGTEVHGVVVDQSGAPVSDAQVVARGAVEGAGYNQARSDSNGSFQFEGLPPGRYSFRADKSGYVSGSTDDVDIQTTPSVRIALKGGGVVFGTVSGFNPEDASRIMVRASSGREGGSSSMDSSGSYRVEGVPAGSVTVTAIVASMGAGRTAPAKTVELTEGGSVQVDLQFNNDTTVEGRVTKLGKPLSGRMVGFIQKPPASQGGGTGQTDQNGHYSITGLQPGDYTVRVVDLSSMQTYNTSYSVQGSGTFDIEINNSSLSGRVLDADSGQPISGAAITVDAAEGEAGMRFASPHAVTAPDGNFRIDSISPGNYHVRGEKSGYGQQIQDASVSDNGSTPVELRLSKQEGVNVRMVDGRDGRNLSGFFVALDGAGREAYSGSGNPQSDGSVSIPLSAGGYRLIVMATTYATRVLRLNAPSAATTVAMTPGGSLEVTSSASVNQQARILDSAGLPYPRGFNISGDVLLRPGVNHWDNIAPGAYTVVLSSAGQSAGSKSVTVTEGQTSRIAF